MHVVTAITLLFLCVNVFSTNPPLPNIFYLGRGYLSYEGNPHTTDPNHGVDPGYRAAVFDVSNFNTTDSKWSIPFGVNVVSCPYCSAEATSSTVVGTSSYYESLKVDVSIHAKGEFFGLGASFAASSDYQNVHKESISYKNVFAETKAICCAYQASIKKYAPPPFTQDFLNGVKQLPLNYSDDPNSYMEFLQYFGTVVIQDATMGGRLGTRSTFSYYSYSQMTSSSLDISSSAKAALISFSAAASVMTDTQKKQAFDYKRFTTDNSMFVVGGQIPSNGSLPAWQQTASENPAPLSVVGVPIFEVMTEISTSEVSASDLKYKIAAMMTANEKLCESYVTAGQITSCTSPGPDPPIPPPSIYGGQYQVDSCSKDNRNNPLTGSLSCLQGFTPSLIAAFIAPDSNCNAAKYVCLKIGFAIDPQHSYGGNYQVCVDIFGHCPRSNVNNPLTNALSCPSGFTPFVTGTALAINSNFQYSEYGCAPPTIPTYESIAGGYQVDDAGTMNVANRYTAAASCPSGYTPQQVGRVLFNSGPQNRGIGAWQYICFASNLLL